MSDPGFPGRISQRKRKGEQVWWEREKVELGQCEEKDWYIKIIIIIKLISDRILNLPHSSLCCSPKLVSAPRPLSSNADFGLSFQPTHYQIPSLYCSYETNSSPYLLLQPIRKEVIHLEPYVVLYHDFVSDSEAQKIKGLAAPWVSVPKACPELPFVSSHTWSSWVWE